MNPDQGCGIKKKKKKNENSLRSINFDRLGENIETKNERDRDNVNERRMDRSFGWMDGK